MSRSRHTAAVSVCLALIIAGFTARSVSAADLCPPLAPPITDTDDRRRTEASFDAKSLSQALNYLKVELPRALLETATTEDVRRAGNHRGVHLASGGTVAAG